MSEKHTPGPWEIHKDLGEPVPQYIYGADTTYVCAIKRVGRQPNSPDVIDTFNANARLIAAAPDLLAACKLALPWISACIDFTGCTAKDPYGADLEELRAAIAKAEGKR